MHLTITVTFFSGGITVSSCSQSHEKTGRLISLYSVSYASYIERSPSAKAACAGAIVESSNDNLRKSMGRFETFSNVNRRVDLPHVSHSTTHDGVLVILHLPVIQHHSAVYERAPSYAQQGLLGHNSALQELRNSPAVRRRRDKVVTSLPIFSWARIKAPVFRPPGFAGSKAPSTRTMFFIFDRCQWKKKFSRGTTGGLNAASFDDKWTGLQRLSR